MTSGDKLHMESFMKEASLMSTLRHPNIVLFLSASIKPPHVYIITELCSKGSLYDVLMNTAPQGITGKMRKQFALDAALGMLYLHSESIIHRDLKTQNLLVNENFSVKVADFGTSKIVTEDRTLTQCGTVTYAAPEIFSRKGRVTHKVDVYSFGIVLYVVLYYLPLISVLIRAFFSSRWDILCLPEELYAGYTMFDIVDEVTKSGLRPPISRVKSQDIRDLMTQCWSADPSQRPEFDEIVQRLRTIPSDSFVAKPLTK
jgi:serine/threonine protein kinase